MTDRVPFSERGGALRGALDMATGRFPRFVFGAGVSRDVLPVFHFHDETRAQLEPKLAYLAENGYLTVAADDIDRFVRGQIQFEGRGVALCFDDAWASLWTVAAPLLKQYGLRAITYAIPARISDASGTRPQAGASSTAGGGDAGPPFVTWPELRSLLQSGVVDVQCHTNTHSRVFCSNEVSGFVTPAFASTLLLNRPQITPPPDLRFMTPSDLGAPLFMARSRMSDGRRAKVPTEVYERCTSLVANEGGSAFFERAEWSARLRSAVESGGNRIPEESENEQQRAIEDELDAGRSVLNARLRTSTVAHICLPWGVSGTRTAAALARLGYRTAFANRMRGVHAVRKGDDPLWLKRLPNKYICRLPGRGRRLWT